MFAAPIGHRQPSRLLANALILRLHACFTLTLAAALAGRQQRARLAFGISAGQQIQRSRAQRVRLCPFHQRLPRFFLMQKQTIGAANMAAVAQRHNPRLQTRPLIRRKLHR